MFHGILPTGPGPIWIAIDGKARKPVVNGQLLRFVRFGGDALIQGVINTRIDGCLFASTAWPKRLPIALSTEIEFALTSLNRRLKNVSFRENVVLRGFGISQKSAA
jgi:hypothetical protein